MAEIRIGELRSQIEVTDTEALLSPRVLAQIVAAVEQALEKKTRDSQVRQAETRIAKQGEHKWL